ncbi:MAG: hypothetical protein L6Q54_07695 [Leptospiraceae bacterium]|nr:hypothetical protein [Leptospiraceae bacterium]MCK6381118.1 hypothetical protein [Leptospiraceae bacterium]
MSDFRAGVKKKHDVFLNDGESSPAQVFLFSKIKIRSETKRPTLTTHRECNGGHFFRMEK